ncbi:hypothetical protein COE15_12425 [Bacillus cereus]|nr:hypothetical protein CN288_21930 [Bacillus sp. AFS023182]PGY00863.1 hypothetical protein COE15_12425 [Bacillus cereus]
MFITTESFYLNHQGDSVDKGKGLMREKERMNTSCISIYGLKPNREEGESRYRLTGLAICNPFFIFK